jgi:acetyl-CoA/propionyl-CoA carboxylase biotin carboxyl carrier protein
VRNDAGYDEGDEVSSQYDNLIAKLIVWGEDREHARRRLIRALEETEIEGVKTTIPAHLAILAHPDFAAAKHSTKWVEDTLDLSTIAAPEPAAAAQEEGEPPRVQRDVDVEVDGRRYRVKLWVPDVGPAVVAGGAAAGAGGRVGAPAGRSRPRPGSGAGGGGGAAGSGNVTVPMQGTIVKILVAEGDTVEVGQAICILEAMKMENNVIAEKAGTVRELRVQPGQAVGAGDTVAVID